MSLNLLKKYNDLLDIVGLSSHSCKLSLKGIFNRDIADNKFFKFRTKQITPTPKDGEILMETLYSHLTTVIVDQRIKKRELDIHRAQRLHWLKHHIEEKKANNMLCF